MKKRLILLLILSMTLMHANVLTKMADEFKNIEKIERAEALAFARKNNIPVRKKFKDGRIKENEAPRPKGTRYLHNSKFS